MEQFIVIRRVKTVRMFKEKRDHLGVHENLEWNVSDTLECSIRMNTFVNATKIMSLGFLIHGC